MNTEKTDQIRVGIFGGSGYGGSELLRILLLHPNVEIVFVTANEQAGKPVGEVHRNLNGLTNLSFVKDPEDLNDIDCVFLALPHGQAMDIVPHLPANVKAIDLSGDFRLRDQSVFEKHYKQSHTAMHAQAEFVYGLTETNREAIRDARFGAQIRLIEENLTDLLQRLTEHTVDIALLPEAEYSSSIRSAPVGEDPLYYVPRRSLEAKGDTVEVESFAADTFVMVPDGCGLARTTKALFESAGVSHCGKATSRSM